MLFLRRFLTTFKRLERFFSQPIFTSVLYDMNTRDNNELKIRTSPQNRQKKKALNFYQFQPIVTRLQICRIPVNNDAYACIPETTRPEIREKQRQKKKRKKFYLFLTRLVPLKSDLSPGKQAQS